MVLAKGLRAVSLPLAVVLIGVGLGLFERHQKTQHDHLSPYAAGTFPQLQGEFLSDLAHQAFELAPGAAQSNILMGTSLAEQGRIKLARVYFERALSIDRRDPRLLFLYARALHALGDDPETIQAIEDELRQYFPLDWEFVQSEFEHMKPKRVLPTESERS